MSSPKLIVFKKELSDILRDRKSVISAILIPLILFPILSFVMGFAFNKSMNSVSENMKISIVSKGDSAIEKYIKSQDNINIIETDNPEEAVEKGDVYLALEIPDNFDETISKDQSSKITMIYDNSSSDSQNVKSAISLLIEQYSKTIVTERLASRNIDETLLNPVVVDEKSSTAEDEGMAKMLVGMIIPLMLMIYAVSGPLAAATDLGAGEKERGTLEPLLTTKANRISILWGKLLAITVMGVITAGASLIGMFIAMNMKNGMFTMGSESGVASVAIEPQAIIIIGVLLVFTTMAFGALELAISIFARSFKEAQTYNSPLIILAMIPTYLTYMMDAKNIDFIYLNIPIANGACVMKEVLSGIYNPLHIGVTFAWTGVYIILAILAARFMFNREDVVFRA
ncbi:ABC transporter permease [Clostridium cellulovorans]|uniref:Na+ ABC transporter, NatB n=1 Tax=Clostridium cellulovorans (strain ATCC 35296 / DSM 3052 / OCM 3 / 743B) TaxID=573061 RepID=D9SVS7_CLOC7|nr:ABC transporter permease [Clostridium cellulovorans]ADL53138.1 Na+ ABC transporter, NatB [Clostridium cellulovorans 743B]